ncbi:MAG TPA: phasin family protein [Vicinamibacteria bacterium]|jgi:polyhydroxyalkanoate synthesis regulator phasin
MSTKRTTVKRRSAPRRPSASAAASAAATVPVWLREQGTALVGQIRSRLDREGRKAYRQMETRMAELQQRLGRDKVTLGRRVDEAVRGTLARLNIPNRREIAELTRKVDELSRKIDDFRARSRRRGGRA